MNAVRRFNQWFDELREPYRFTLFAVVLGGWVPLMYIPYETAWIIGAAWMFVATMIVILRRS